MPALSAANLLWLGMPVFSAPPREPAFPFPIPAIGAIGGGFSRYGHSIKACYLRQNLFSVEGRQTSPKSQGILSVLNKLNCG